MPCGRREGYAGSLWTAAAGSLGRRHRGAMPAYRVTRERVHRTEQLLGPGPWACGDLYAQAWSPQQLEGAVRRGALVRVTRGLYLAAETASSASPVERSSSSAHVRAVLARLDARATLSHASAAAVHQTWTPGRPTSCVHVTIPGKPERRAPGLRVHASRLPAEFVTTVDGLRVTGLARTAIDLARGAAFPDALVAVDGAWRRSIELARPNATEELRTRIVPPDLLRRIGEQLEDAYAVTWSWPGTRVVRAALDTADPASESPYESWSRGWLILAGLPAAELNAVVTGASGQNYAGDFVWRAQRVIGEADGLG